MSVGEGRWQTAAGTDSIVKGAPVRLGVGGLGMAWVWAWQGQRNRKTNVATAKIIVQRFVVVAVVDNFVVIVVVAGVIAKHTQQ